ncbi:hypothetical protein R6Q57_023670 [Mikania cordata]
MIMSNGGGREFRRVYEKPAIGLATACSSLEISNSNSDSKNFTIMSIPKSFRKHLKSRRKNRVVILRRGNQKWAVKMGKDWVFGEGWDSFMTDNGVQDFDIVVFKHQENMVFDIIVFDTTWCEREYVNNQVTKRFKKRKLNNNGEYYMLPSSIYNFYKNLSVLKSARRPSLKIVIDQEGNPKGTRYEMPAWSRQCEIALYDSSRPIALIY